MLSVTGARIPSHLRMSIPEIAEGCQHAASCTARISAPRSEQKVKLQWFSCTEQLLCSTDRMRVCCAAEPRCFSPGNDPKLLLLDFRGGSCPAVCLQVLPGHISAGIPMQSGGSPPGCRVCSSSSLVLCPHCRPALLVLLVAASTMPPCRCVGLGGGLCIRHCCQHAAILKCIQAKT